MSSEKVDVWKNHFTLQSDLCSFSEFYSAISDYKIIITMNKPDMKAEFDLKNWENIAVKLKKKYPRLTDADLIWRHETKTDFYMLIAAQLGITTNQLEQIIAQLQTEIF